MSAGPSRIPELAALFPYQGRCAFCGGPDARHRLWDSIKDNAEAGDPPEWAAAEYSLTVEQVNAVVQHWHGKRLRKAVHV